MDPCFITVTDEPGADEIKELLSTLAHGSRGSDKKGTKKKRVQWEIGKLENGAICRLNCKPCAEH